MNKMIQFGDWLCKGGDGWLHMIEKLSAEKHLLSELSLGQLRTLHARLAAVIAEQESLREE
jgi:hypothetical protein